MIIQPLKQYLVEHSINNPSDTTTYYCQIVITDSVNRANLATLNLGAGNPYWSLLWITPADTSGTGRQITIQKTVYTDSLYTNVSPVYGSVFESHILRNVAGGFGQPLGGFTREITSSDVEKVLRKVMAETPLPEKQKEYDDSDIKNTLNDVYSKLDDISATHESRLSDLEKHIMGRIDDNHLSIHSIIGGKFKELHDVLKKQSEESENKQSARHSEIINGHNSLKEHISNNISDIHDKIDKASENAQELHEEAMDMLGQPINIDTTSVGQRIQTPRTKKRTNDDEQKSTVDKLLELSNR